LSVDQALDRLISGAGTQFDARCVKLFVRYIREKGSQMVLAEPEV